VKVREAERNQPLGERASDLRCAIRRLKRAASDRNASERADIHATTLYGRGGWSGVSPLAVAVFVEDERDDTSAGFKVVIDLRVARSPLYCRPQRSDALTRGQPEVQTSWVRSAGPATRTETTSRSPAGRATRWWEASELTS